MLQTSRPAEDGKASGDIENDRNEAKDGESELLAKNSWS
jgi:hypothetical protein